MVKFGNIDPPYDLPNNMNLSDSFSLLFLERKTALARWWKTKEALGLETCCFFSNDKLSNCQGKNREIGCQAVLSRDARYIWWTSKNWNNMFGDVEFQKYKYLINNYKWYNAVPV